MNAFECLKDQCRSPVACGGWGYCREKNFDYERSCEYASDVMREREIAAGRLSEDGKWQD
jgi:hypothetical protein